MNNLIKSTVAALALTIGTGVAASADDVTIGTGYGIGFLPLHILDAKDLIEARAKEAGIDLTPTFQRISGSAAMQDAVISGSVDLGAYGIPAILIGWDKTRGKIVGVAGVNASPLTLLSNREGVTDLKGFAATDRIAMPSLVSPQMYALQKESEAEFGEGQQDKLREQVVALPHPEALNAITAGATEVNSYFSAPPFTQIALKSPNVHAVTDSEKIFGGKSTFLALASTSAYLEDNPDVPAIIVAALDDAAKLIRENPEEAADIYLAAEPSKVMTKEDLIAFLRENPDDFGPEVHGVQAYADFMGRHGGLSKTPANWQEVFPSAVLNGREGS